MKRSVLMIALFLGFGLMAQAQQKIGHVNSDELLQMMPETKQAQKELEAYGQQLEKDLTDMEDELNTKFESFRANEKMMTTLARETKTQELQELQRRIQEYSQRAQQDLQQKQVELLTPVIEKATKAVEDVAEENGFDYILDSSQSKAVIIYAGGGEDIMPLVKAKLGLSGTTAE
jgi:outer membrane protein